MRTMIYTVDLGDGQVMDIEGPEGVTPEQLQSFVAQNQPPQQAMGTASPSPATPGQPTAQPQTPAPLQPDQTQQQILPGGEQQEAVTGAERRDDPALRGVKAQYLSRLERGDGPAALLGYLKDAGVRMTPSLVQSVQAQAAFRQKYRDTPIADYDVSQLDDMFVPRSGAQQAIAAAADSPYGAASVEFANTLTAGTLDEIVGALGGNAEQAQAAKEALRQDYPVSSLIGGGAGGVAAVSGVGRVPGLAGKTLLTDAALGAAYGAGESNEDRATGAATGATAAVAGNYFGGKLIERLQRPPQPSQSALRVAAAKDYGIDLPIGAAGGRGSAITESILDNQIASANVMQASRNKLAQQVEGAVDAVAGKFGGDVNFAGVGEAAQRGAKQAIDRYAAEATKLYDEVPISPQANAQVGETVAALTRVNTKFASNPKLAALLGNSRLSNYLDALSTKVRTEPTGILDASGNPITREVAEGGSLSWNDLKDFRSRIGEEISDQRFSDGTLKSELRDLYGALSRDMEATATAIGPEALQKFRRANDYYRAKEARIERALVPLLGDARDRSAEAAAAFIQRISKEGKSSSDLAALAAIRRSLPKDEWGEVANGMIKLLGQPANAAGREFNPGTFVRNYDSMAPEARNLMFSGPGEPLRQSLDGFVSVMRDIAGRNALRNTSNTAPASLGNSMVGPLLGATSGPLGALAGFFAQQGMAYGAARIWTNPRFVNWATGYAKMVRGAKKAGGKPDVAKQVELLRKVARAEPAIATEVSGLADYIAAAANDNFSRVTSAAASNEEGDQN